MDPSTRPCRRCKQEAALDPSGRCEACAETLRLRKVLLGLALGFGAILALVAKELRLW